MLKNYTEKITKQVPINGMLKAETLERMTKGSSKSRIFVLLATSMCVIVVGYIGLFGKGAAPTVSAASLLRESYGRVLASLENGQIHEITTDKRTGKKIEDFWATDEAYLRVSYQDGNLFSMTLGQKNDDGSYTEYSHDFDRSYYQFACDDCASSVYEYHVDVMNNYSPSNREMDARSDTYVHWGDPIMSGLFNGLTFGESANLVDGVQDVIMRGSWEITLTGEGMIDGHDVYVLSSTAGGGLNGEDGYIDKDTLLPVGYGQAGYTYEFLNGEDAQSLTLEAVFHLLGMEGFATVQAQAPQGWHSIAWINEHHSEALTPEMRYRCNGEE